MEENNRNNKKKSLWLFLAVAIVMITLNWILIDIMTCNQQAAYIKEETEEETETVETEETEQEEVELNKVYTDLGLEVDDKLTISDDGEYFSYNIWYYSEDVINFISKVDNSLNYEILDIYKEGSYTYVIFKYTEEKELHNKN